jgi:enoyl-CoA hydratase
LARSLAELPQTCLRSDRRSAYDSWSLDLDGALAREYELGRATRDSGESREGAARFAAGEGRHGTPAPRR